MELTYTAQGNYMIPDLTLPKEVSEFELKHITTGDILIEALEKGYIMEADGNTIWASMLAKLRKLGAGSFSEYIGLKSK